MKLTSPKKRPEVLMAIHRHWIWADRIRDEYFERLKDNPSNDADLVAFFLTGHGMYLCLWFALEFAVCEELQVRGFEVPTVQKEIKAILNSLEDFRNSIFHIQPDYLSIKMFKLLNRPKHQVTIDKIHKEVGQWLSDELGI